MPSEERSPAGSMPTRIGRYVVERELGRGGMGVIYKAHDPEIDRPVAIKLIRADLLGEQDDDYLLRFRREAQAAARCAHPNIVAIYDFAVDRGCPFLTMEFLEGVTLGQEMERARRFSLADSAAILLQVLDALSAAHAQGIVHRDIKPANVLLLDRLRVKVMDFGIARPAASELTQAGAIIGSPHYMSPEQFRGEAVDHRADLFSAGILLFQLVTGERPFPGSSFAEIAYRVVNDTPDLGRRAAEVPALAQLLARALAKRAEDRFTSAAAMAQALRSALEEDAEAVMTVIAPARSPGGAKLAASSATHPPPVGAPSAITQVAISPRLAATAERELARHLGPIAKVLVRRAMGSPSPDAFRRALAAHIDKEADRAAFLASTRAQ